MLDFEDVCLDDFVEDLEHQRFAFLDVDDWSFLSTAAVCPNTRRKLLYVNSLFNQWREARNSRNGHELQFVPEKKLVDFVVEELNL